ncbi:uncharacterized protein LOC142319927 [Lycorma delicatula]|uniref:uncharacterized protein LOC142319927 n=1 Tax=Lycorma delicatula TaxID=130591 RepID=UPI003F5171EC
MWRENIEKGSLEMFPSSCDLASEREVNVEEIKSIISKHLTNLETEYCNLFKDLRSIKTEFQVMNPFAANVKIDHLSVAAQEQEIDMRETTLQYRFKGKSLYNWWMELKTDIQT